MLPYLSPAQAYEIVLNELANNIDRYCKNLNFQLARDADQRADIEMLRDGIAFEKRKNATADELYDDLAQELAVTQSQLEEARKRLKHYEGGGE